MVWRHQMKNKSRRSKIDILAFGLDILSEYGEGELTIDFLCQKLGVTKGSFYHHFKSRDLFLENSCFIGKRSKQKNLSTLVKNRIQQKSDIAH